MRRSSFLIIFDHLSLYLCIYVRYVSLSVRSFICLSLRFVSCRVVFCHVSFHFRVCFNLRFRVRVVSCIASLRFASLRWVYRLCLFFLSCFVSLLSFSFAFFVCASFCLSFIVLPTCVGSLVRSPVRVIPAFSD